jgi:hypothetical protein
LKRMKRLDARREKAKAEALAPRPQVSDAELLREGEALENAWRFEVAALMVLRRLNTPEVAAVAERARAVTQAVVERIEAARAISPAGREVKARAVLWRRNGEPLEDESCDATASNDNAIDMEMSHDR